MRETIPIFGELPRFDAGTYTFLSDYLPWASGDGMEHRNSTVLSAPGALRNASQRQGILGTVAHEFFHAWNMERIRSRAIEPFDYEDANVSSDLWFGEGVTSYFDDLIVYRAGLQPLDDLLESYAGLINAVALAPGRRIRSAEEMSQLAPFVDAAVSIDRTAWNNTFISYYTWGAMLGIALDLSLLEKTAGKAGMDDYMRLMWTSYGVPGMKAAPGMVARTYSREELQGRLAQLSGDGAFAQQFFARFVQGHDVPDFAALFARLGLVVRKRNAGRAWLGDATLAFTNGGLRAGVVPFESPLYKAGVAEGDQIISLAGVEVTTAQAVQEVLMRYQPGARLALRFVRRSGEAVTIGMNIDEDPRIEIVPAETTGATVTPEQRQARLTWLAARAK